jgi:ribonuclease HII
MMRSSYTNDLAEAGCDEAGRGCLAGPVFAAAVILPKNFSDPDLRDSKKCTAVLREALRLRIQEHAIAWAVASVDNGEIDQINILQASFLAMHRALDQLRQRPELILVDGNRFKAWKGIPHHCIVKGDDLYFSIAAASILAKTSRDSYMKQLHEQFPQYGWDHNKGYPTREHRLAIRAYGITPFHRRSFTLAGQLSLPLE